MSTPAPGFRQLQQELQDLAARAGDPRPVLRDVAEEYRQAQAGNFASGGRPRWRPLSPEYAARKAQEGRGRQIGVYSGGLRDSLVRTGDRYHLERVTREQLEIGTRNPVANLFNNKHSGRNQPKRKVQILTPKMRREYLQMVQQFLTGSRRP